MKKIFIILLVISQFSFAQDSTVKKSINNPTNKEKLILKESNTVLKKITDTAEINLKNGIEESISSNTKIVLIKEERKTDYLKYLLPIFTLLLGIGIKYLIEILADKKKIKKVGERWIAEIRSLEIPLKKQIDALDKFLESHKKNTFETPELTIYSILNCQVFNSLDKSDFLSYLESKKKIEYKEVINISNRTHGFISVITHLYETLQSRFKDYLEGASSHTTSLSINLQAMLKEFAEYGILIEKEIEKDPISDSRYKPIFNLINTHIFPLTDSGDYKIFKLETDFFIPLLQVLGHLRLDERTRSLSITVSNCLNDIKGIRMQKHYANENITKIIERYKIQSNELKNVLAQIEN